MNLLFLTTIKNNTKQEQGQVSEELLGYYITEHGDLYSYTTRLSQGGIRSPDLTSIVFHCQVYSFFQVCSNRHAQVSKAAS